MVVKFDPVPHGFTLLFCKTNAFPHSEISLEHYSSRKRSSVRVGLLKTRLNLHSFEVDTLRHRNLSVRIMTHLQQMDLGLGLGLGLGGEYPDHDQQPANG